MSAKTDEFINTLAPIVVELYTHCDKWVLPSIIIAMGALESGWNINAESLFGIKGNGFISETKEYVNGEWVTQNDSFVKYPTLADSVCGLWELLTTNPRYSKCYNNADFENVAYFLINTTDGYPYATDPEYIEKITSIIKDYNLTRFDSHNFNIANDENILYSILERINTLHIDIGKLLDESYALHQYVNSLIKKE